MRFVVTPHNILNCNSRALIATDDYSDDEIRDGRHIRDIKADFRNSRLRRDWKSDNAFIYPLLDDGPDLRHYLKIKI